MGTTSSLKSIDIRCVYNYQNNTYFQLNELNLKLSYFVRNLHIIYNKEVKFFNSNVSK